MPRRTDQYLKVHLWKTGGTWLSELMWQIGCEVVGGGHDPVWWPNVVAARGTRTVVGTARPPLPWYVSWYVHCLTAEGKDKDLRVYGAGSLDFKDVLYGATHPTPDRTPVRFNIIPEVESELSGVANGAPRDAYLAAGWGLYTWGMRWVYGTKGAWLPGAPIDLSVDEIVFTEDLYAWASRAFGRHVTPASHPPRNTGKARLSRKASKEDFVPPESWYDEESRRWVEDADGEMTDHLWDIRWRP